jgi:hypothetical protein
MSISTSQKPHRYTSLVLSCLVGLYLYHHLAFSFFNSVMIEFLSLMRGIITAGYGKDHLFGRHLHSTPYKILQSGAQNSGSHSFECQTHLITFFSNQTCTNHPIMKIIIIQASVCHFTFQWMLLWMKLALLVQYSHGLKGLLEEEYNNVLIA